MTTESNHMFPVPVFSTSAAPTTPATPTTSAGWYTPTTEIMTFTGFGLKRALELATLEGTIIVSANVAFPPSTVDTTSVIWDMNCEEATALTASGGYSLRVTAGAAPSLEVRYRPAGGNLASIVTVITTPLDDLFVYSWYPSGSPVGEKTGRDFQIGVAVNVLADFGTWMDLYVDGTLRLSNSFDGAALPIGLDTAGLRFWGTSNIGAATPLQLLNTIDTEFKTQAHFFQRIEGDQTERVAAIMHSLYVNPTTFPAPSRGM